MKMLIKLTDEQVELLMANGNVGKNDWTESVYLPFIFTRDPESDDKNTFEMEELNSKSLSLFVKRYGFDITPKMNNNG